MQPIAKEPGFPSIADDLSVDVVEGACPGSSYIGAELRMPVDEVNELATQFRYPVRFKSKFQSDESSTGEA